MPHAAAAYGPQAPASKAVFSFKYAQSYESYRDVCNRVAAMMADNDQHYRPFRQVMLEGIFSTAGRILSGLGTTKTTPYNCFVSGTIEDSLNGPGGIMDRLAQAAETLRRGGGIGYDFSPIRPRNDKVRSLDSRASGPVSYMRMYHAMADTISSSGERRGAQMAVLRVDHPDIEEYIHAKQNDDQLRTFNLSIAVTDEFMDCVKHGREFALRFDGRTYRMIDARILWEKIMRSTWDWAEPGVIFIDRVNFWNNLNYCEAIAATNPCSEQPLPPFGACLLGSINLTKLLVPAGPGKKWRLDLDALEQIMPTIVRAMDNIVDVASYPLPEQRQQAIITRRMGLGVMGTANAIEACGYPYGTDDFVDMLDSVLGRMTNAAYMASAMLAKEKGAAPCYRPEYCDGPFIKTLRPDVQAAIKEHGIRNSHLISIAPTGTISFVHDDISSGIEPVFAVKGKQLVRMENGAQEYDVEDYGFARLGVVPRAASEISAQEHIRVLATAQKHTDSAVSKTANVPSDTPWRDFQSLYFDAFDNGCQVVRDVPSWREAWSPYSRR